MKKIYSLRFLAISLSVIALFNLTGCATGSKVRFDSEKRPLRTQLAVQVFDAGDITRPHKVIGIVNARSLSMQAALDCCRKEAGELGADAITGFGLKNSECLNTYTAKAIVWQ